MNVITEQTARLLTVGEIFRITLVKEHSRIILESRGQFPPSNVQLLFSYTRIHDTLRDLNFTTFPGGAIRRFPIDLCDP